MGIGLSILEQSLKKTGRIINSVSLEVLEKKMPGTTAVFAMIGSNFPVAMKLPETVTCMQSLRVPERNDNLV